MGQVAAQILSLNVLAALADGLEKAHGGGSRNIETLDLSCHRNRGQLVAAFRRQSTDSSFLSAENDGERLIEVGGVEIFVGTVGGADDMHEAFGELLESAG